MRSGYYEAESDKYTICDVVLLMQKNNYVYFDHHSYLLINAYYKNANLYYNMGILISPDGNHLYVNHNVMCGYQDIILKSSYRNFIYNNIERIISDGSELELGRFIHTEFVKLVEHHSEYGNTDNYVFSQPPTKK
jgi:hypothetical protein